MSFSIPNELLPPPRRSWKKVLASLSEEKQEQILSNFADDELYQLMGDWFLSARREQFPPLGDWFIWLIMAGRGFGKTFTGAHFIINNHRFGDARNSAIVAATSTDLRRFCIEGPSGILSQAPREFYPEDKPSKLKLVWPNGTETHYYTSEKPHRLRGPNHDYVWCDELSYWRYPDDCWDNMMFSMRYGETPQMFISMTPRNIRLIKALLEREGKDVIVTRGSTIDNRDNLSRKFIEDTIEQYRGTRLWDQEVLGRFLEDLEGALWSRELIDQNRILRPEEVPDLKRVAVAIDPAISSGEKADETGIIVGGVDFNKQGYVLADYSLKGTPDQWARKAIHAYHHHKADIMIAEKNQGGEMITHTIHSFDETIPVKLTHASRGKVTRAEPVSAIDEQHRIHHVGVFPKLEDEMCSFVPEDIDAKKFSPNRVDARTWLFNELMVSPRKKAGAWGRRKRAA